jgi:hypothetical protein
MDEEAKLPVVELFKSGLRSSHRQKREGQEQKNH